MKSYLEDLQRELALTEMRLKNTRAAGARRILKISIRQINRDILREKQRKDGTHD